jgi:hypothetical protein
LRNKEEIRQVRETCQVFSRRMKGRLKYCYNFVGLQHFFAEGDRPIPAGTHQVRMEFAYDGGGPGKGGGVTLYERKA